VVDGVPQEPIDGVSFAYTFDDPSVQGRLRTQYFEIMGSRAIYHDGWIASAFGPRAPWVPGTPPGIADWTPDQDTWELYNLDQDWSQANDLAAQMPDKLAQLKETFAIEAAKNSVYPVGGGLWIPVFHPELRISTPYREWNFTGDIIRMPEFCAPALGNRANVVTIDLDIPPAPAGVLYALGGAGGGLTCYVDNGYLCFEYNTFIVMRTKIRAEQTLPSGTATIQVSTEYAEPRPAGPLNITMTVNGDQVAHGQVPVSAPLLFTANDCLDIGTCLGSAVSLDYYDRAPFPFNGQIHHVNVRYTA
jgi:arylsulfatase